MSKSPFEILEHTADVGIKAYGSTLPELFVNAGRGLIALALSPSAVGPVQSLPLSVRGEDREDLLVQWLSEILYFLDAEGWFFCDFRIQQLQANALAGEGLGECRTEAGQRPRSVVKAVTYHQVSVQETPEGWEAVVYFDI